MSFVVKKKNLVDGCIILLMYLQLVILEFFGLGQILNKVVAILIILRIVLLRGKLPYKIIMVSAILFLLFFLSTFLGEVTSIGVVRSNFLILLYPALYAYYIAYLCYNRPDFIDNVIGSGFKVFNFTIILNLIVLLFQILRPYSIVAVATDNRIDYLEDTISGLFAYSSTHVVSLFTVFVVLYNFSYRKSVNNILLQRILSLYNVFLIVVSLYISMFNDNKAMFLLLPICLFIYWLTESRNRSRRYNRIVLSAISVPMLLYIAYTFIPSFHSFVDENFLNTIIMASKAVSIGNKANGSTERIAIIGYALSKPSTWFLGTGFGSSALYAAGYQGFLHFGQSDIGSIMILGGIWVFVVISMLFIKILLTNIDCDKKNALLVIGIIILLFVTVMYTQCFSRTNTTMCLLLISLSFRLMYRN